MTAASLGAVVGDEEGRLDRLDQQVEGDLLLPHQAPQGTHVDVHGYASSFVFSVLAVELDLARAPWRSRAKASRRAVGLRPFTPGTSRSRPSSSTVEDPGDQLAALVELELDQPADGAHVVTVLGERALGAGGADLEGVLALAHRVGLVELRRERAAHSAIASRSHAVVGVDDDPQHPLAACRSPPRSLRDPGPRRLTSGSSSSRSLSLWVVLIRVTPRPRVLLWVWSRVRSKGIRSQGVLPSTACPEPRVRSRAVTR